MHELLGLRWPCDELAGAERVQTHVSDALRESGVATGRGAYAGWDDGDPAIVRAAWCLTRHLRPSRVVETGVGRGVTSRTLLEGLALNGKGRLWSIDLPPLLRPELLEEVALVVPPERRTQWTLVRGSSRHRLPALLDGLGTIDLFVHDSLHTERNMRFEMERAWAALRVGGAMLLDDVHRNGALHRWCMCTPEARSVTALADDEQAQFAIVVKEPASPGGAAP
jgi:hypothetical protein